MREIDLKNFKIRTDLITESVTNLKRKEVKEGIFVSNLYLEEKEAKKSLKRKLYDD